MTETASDLVAKVRDYIVRVGDGSADAADVFEWLHACADALDEANQRIENLSGATRYYIDELATAQSIAYEFAKKARDGEPPPDDAVVRIALRFRE